MRSQVFIPTSKRSLLPGDIFKLVIMTLIKFAFNN